MTTDCNSYSIKSFSYSLCLSTSIAFPSSYADSKNILGICKVGLIFTGERIFFLCSVFISYWNLLMVIIKYSGMVSMRCDFIALSTFLLQTSQKYLLSPWKISSSKLYITISYSMKLLLLFYGYYSFYKSVYFWGDYLYYYYLNSTDKSMKFSFLSEMLPHSWHWTLFTFIPPRYF